MKRRPKRRSNRHRLRIERLENRRVLAAATNLGAVSGVVFDDANNNGSFDAGDVAIPGATIELFRDNGNNVFDAGDTPVLPFQQTNASGVYQFEALTAGNYFARQPSQTTTGGRPLTESVSPLIIVDANDVQGQQLVPIDTFDGNVHSVEDTTNDGVPVAVAQAASEAIGGERDLFVNKTSVNGSIALSVNDPLLPNTLTFDSNQTGDGVRRIVWDGVDGDATVVDDTGLALDFNLARGASLEIGADQTGGTVTVRAYADDGVPGTASRFSAATIPIPNTGGGTTIVEFIPESSFAGAVDLSTETITAIELEIGGATNINGQATLVEILQSTFETQNFSNFNSADLSLNKSVDDPTPNVGQQVTYTISVTNSGPSTATGVQVTESLPNGLTIVNANTSQGNFNQATGVWDVGNIGTAGGANAATLTLIATVDSVGAKSNSAEITAAGQSDPDSTPNNGVSTEDDQEAVTITPEQIDLSLSKIVNNSAPNVGETVVFTVAVNNAGPSIATGVSVQDVLPQGISFVSANATNGSAYNSANGVWSVGTVPAGGTVTLTLSGTVDSPGNRTNVAEVIAANEQDIDSTPGNNILAEDDQASAVFASSQADLSLTKAVNNSTPNVGENIIFTIGVQNAGPDTATNVSVTDLLPQGLNFVSSSQPADYNPTTGVWTVGSVAPGATQTLSITANATSLNTTTNTAQVRTSDQPDPDSSPNNGVGTEDDQESVTITPGSANVSLTKTVNNSSPSVGEQVTFQIIVSNAGPNTATGVQVRDQLPTGLNFVSASTPDFNSTTGIWNVGTIPVGGSQTLNLVTTSNTTVSQTNTAEVIASDQFDPNSTPGNSVEAEDDQASVQLQAEQIDLSLTKSVSNPTPNVGSEVDFVITVRNDGPSNATGVQVTESLPTGVSLVSSSPSLGSFNTTNGVWTVGSLPIGSSQTLTLRTRVDSVLNTFNTAQVTDADQADVDSTPGNNIASEDDQDSAAFITPQADLSLTKSVDNPSPNVGDNVTFTIAVQNAGPDTATGIQVTDTLPAGIRFVSNNLSTGSFNSGTGVWSIDSLTTTTTATLEIIGEVLSLGQSTNSAEITASNQSDPDSTPANNIAAEDDQDSVSFTTQQVDLSLTKTASVERPAIGQTFAYTLTVTNSGTDTATGVQVTDTLPAGVTYVGSSPTGAFNPATGVWTVGSVAPGASQSIDINVTADTLGDKTNVAEITAVDQTDVDSTPGNGVTTEDDYAVVTNTPASADLSVSKTIDDANPNVGQIVTFNVSVSNAGPDAATNIQVRDTLPGSVSFASATAPAGTSYDSATGIWTVPSLGVNESRTLVIQATADAVGDVSNIAEVIASSQFDPDSTPNNNNTAEDDQASAALSPELVDLALTKILNTASPNVGDTISYTVSLSNDGPSTATGIQVTDLLPSALAFVNAQPSTGTYNQSNGQWAIDSLAANTSTTLVLTATVGNTQAVTNTAEVTAVDQPDLDSTPNNNIETEDDQASASFDTQIADLSLSKTVDNATPGRDDNVTFTVTLTNDGPNTATDVVVSDLLPSGLRFISSSPSVGTYDIANGLWSVPSVPVGASATLLLVSQITSSTVAPNVAEIRSARQFDIDSTPGNGISTEDDIATAAVDPQVVDISVVGSVDNAEPLEGESIQIVFAASNAGPDPATNVSLRAPLPAGLTLLSSQPQTGNYDSVTGEWVVGGLAPGETTQLVLNAQVDQRGIREIPIEVIATDQFDVDSTPANDVGTEDDQVELLVRAPRLLQKRLFMAR